MKTHCYVNGDELATETYYENVDPSTGAVLGEVARSGAKEVAAAVHAARAAQPAWSRMSPSGRADVLERIAKLIIENLEELARVESQDSGKPISQARSDVRVCARYFQFYARAVETFYGYQIPLGESLQAITTREPHGVIGQILAWNYPLQLFGRAVAPAIATGNTVVVKPADETPRTAVMVAKLAQAADLPAGVINVVTGYGAEAGAALAANSDLNQIGFVGSTQVGIQIAQSAAVNVVPSVLELGGKSPHVIFSDADLDLVIPTVVKGIIQNAGQTCSAGSRIIVNREIHAEVIDRLAREMSKVTIGPGLSDPDLGPLISKKQQDRVRALVQNAEGTVVAGGGPGAADLNGYYFPPTLIDDVDPLSTIAQEEVFGPVVVAMSADSDDEAVRLANATEYGLIAGVWTKDIDRALKVASGIQAGQVYINAFGSGDGGVELPFGGFKKSGYGREKGVEAMFAATRTKTTIFRIS